MNWNDIETKWAAMARRIRSDLSPDQDVVSPLADPSPLPTGPAVPVVQLPARFDRSDA